MVKMFYRGEEFNKILASKVAQAPELWAAAEKCNAKIMVSASAHRVSGAYQTSIHTSPRLDGKKKGRGVDVQVVCEIPYAAHLEFGHVLSEKNTSVKPPGSKGVSKPRKPSHGHGVSVRRGAKWVNGLHLMRNAAIACGGMGAEDA